MMSFCSEPSFGLSTTAILLPFLFASYKTGESRKNIQVIKSYSIPHIKQVIECSLSKNRFVTTF